MAINHRKSTFRWILCLVLALIPLFLPVSSQGQTVDAKSRIFIYNQTKGNGHWMKCPTCGSWIWSEAGYWSKQTKKYGNIDVTTYCYGNHKGIAQRGCGLLAAAHAMQWLTGEKPTTRKEKIMLLVELLQVENNPAIHGLTKYYRYLEKNYGCRAKIKNQKVYSLYNESSIRSLFDSGSLIVYFIGNTDSGHYAIAVGWSTYEDTLYIQLVDSSISSTAKYIDYRVYKYDGYTQWKPDSSSTTSNYGRYWVKWEDFRKYFTVKAILSSDYSENQVKESVATAES